MKTSSKRVIRAAAVLVLILAGGCVLAGLLPTAFGAIALLACALVACGLHLARNNLRDRQRLNLVRAALARERRARRRTERSLADANRVLNRLGREQAGVRDAERSRIARDIHDDLGQNLLALRIDLSLMQVATSGIHPALHQKIAGMANNVDSTIRSLRAVINNLRPLALGEGLRCAVQRQLVEFSRVSGVPHELDAPAAGLDERCDDGAADTVLYRVLQESLSNVARHAHASLVWVALGRDGGQLTLRVADNGIGIGTAAQDGCGLAGMRERASAAGGQFAIASRPGGGTVLTLSLPLRQAAVSD